MATTDDIKSLLQQQAEKKINPFMRGLSLLTGGIAGEFTGTNEDIRSRALAKQALFQEEINKRDEERTLARQLMVNALQQGIAAPEGATLEEKMADFRNKALRRQIAATEGKLFGYGQTIGPSQYEAEPAFQVAAGESQARMKEREAELRQTRDLEVPELVSGLSAYGVKASPDMPVGQLKAMFQQEVARSQSRIPAEERGNQAKAGLMFLQQKGEIPSVIDIYKMSPEEAVAQYNILGEEYRQKNRDFAFERKAEAENKAVDDFNLLLSNPNRDQEALKKAYLKLPKDSKLEEYRIAAGVARPANTKENESLDKYIAAVDRSSALVGSIQSLVGNRSIPDVSQESFNGFTSWMRGAKNKLGAEDPSLRSINNVVQEFQALIAQQRKDFFGASLTDNEFEVAKQLFADPKQANFLPRVLELVDSIMSKDEIQNKYTRRGIFVDAETKKDIGDKRSKYYKIKSELNFGGPKNSSASRNSEAKKLRGEFDALKAYITNAPSVSITNTPTSAQ
jgi:hypothetical protein